MPLAILLSAFGSIFVFGQGGTGREPPPPPPNKTSTTKKAPARTNQPAKPRQTAPQIEMVLIPAGMFTMGSPDDEAGRKDDEGPQHQVSVGSFYIGKFEVTQAQYRAVMGTNPSDFKGDSLPVDGVSWNDAVEFCRKLSRMTGRDYRLPSEAEWEYACRAGTETPFAFGASLSSEQANFDGNYPYGGAAKGVYRERTMVVGSFQPNAFGAYDMHGNVWEWCEDWYHDNYHGAPNDGSAWLSGGAPVRVLRGGSWHRYSTHLRSATRLSFMPESRGDSIGFRLAADVRTQ